MANSADNQVSRYANSRLTRKDFGSDFVFGAATSAYQVEGAYKQSGKAMSNWDVFSICQPGKIKDGSNGCVAIGQCHRYKDDVALMKKMGLDAYRFSISWARILPGGRLSAGVNKDGVKYYSDLIDSLLLAGIEPYVTVFHFDVPNCLEEQYGGFLSHRIVQDFGEFAEVCFFEFGDRVKHWITINEPWSFTHNGYITGSFPPSHGSNTETRIVRHRVAHGVDRTILGGNPSTEPYIVAHHLILAHAKAVDVYRKNYQGVQGGKIGMTNMTTWFDPLYDTEEDIAAAERAVEFMWGWFVSPMVTGDYPAVMRERVGHRLPTFNAEETKLVKGSYDFIGMNYYTSNYAAYKATPPGTRPTYYTDQEVDFFGGIYKLLKYTRDKDNNPLIYITENGADEKNDRSLAITDARVDKTRVKYHQDHLAFVKKAMDDKDGPVNVKAYFVWSMFDNYEWAEGYTVRFGLFLVDYVNELGRYPKSSAIWYMNFLHNVLHPPAKRQVEEIEEDNNNSTTRKRIKQY
ncbi:hypothetical protein DH2020_018399 [Rehmannia glutinosa]|uniref:Beta-glucosidase n=1 Tax=Rehmannia glutinosa TaxID=99300 RepID=A0ABR0WJ58_REHGL